MNPFNQKSFRTLHAYRTISVAVLTLMCVSVCSVLHAQPIASEDALWISGFEGEIIQPQFPIVDGQYVLPDYSVAHQLEWVISELAVGEVTTLAEVQQRFTSAFDAQTIADFFNNNLRVNFPDAEIIDLVTMTPVGAVAVIDGVTGPDSSGFLQINSLYSGNQEITFLQVQNFFGTVQFPEDQLLNLEQAVNKFETLNPQNSIFIGYINRQGQCQPIQQRQATITRGLGSIFKMWVLGGVASEMSQNLINADDAIALVAEELGAGGTININPLGTLFSVRDMATLMMGISDNSATDHLHELVGRNLIGQMVEDFGVADPDLLRPFLNISEQFHVFSRFDLPTAQSYVNGTEAFQQQFLVNEIEPLGSSVPEFYPFLHQEIITNGTWAASPVDICQTFAGLYRSSEQNDAFVTVDTAMGSTAAFPNIREAWDRVWYKGGSLASSVDDLHILANAWLLENSGDFPPYIVVGLANDTAGNINQFAVNSVLARIVELVRNFEP